MSRTLFSVPHIFFAVRHSMQRRATDGKAYALAALVGSLLTFVSAVSLGLFLTLLMTNAFYEYPEELDMSMHDMSSTIKLPQVYRDGRKRYARWELVFAVGVTALLLVGSVVRFFLEVAAAWDGSKLEGPLSVKVTTNRWLWQKFLDAYQFIDVDAPSMLRKATQSQNRCVHFPGTIWRVQN